MIIIQFYNYITVLPLLLILPYPTLSRFLQISKYWTHIQSSKQNSSCLRFYSVLNYYHWKQTARQLYDKVHHHKTSTVSTITVPKLTMSTITVRKLTMLNPICLVRSKRGNAGFELNSSHFDHKVVTLPSYQD